MAVQRGGAGEGGELWLGVRETCRFQGVCVWGGSSCIGPATGRRVLNDHPLAHAPAQAKGWLQDPCLQRPAIGPKTPTPPPSSAQAKRRGMGIVGSTSNILDFVAGKVWA